VGLVATQQVELRQQSAAPVAGGSQAPRARAGMLRQAAQRMVRTLVPVAADSQESHDHKGCCSLQCSPCFVAVAEGPTQQRIR